MNSRSLAGVSQARTRHAVQRIPRSATLAAALALLAAHAQASDGIAAAVGEAPPAGFEAPAEVTPSARIELPAAAPPAPSVDIETLRPIPRAWVAADAVVEPREAREQRRERDAQTEARIEANKSWSIPALEIILFDVLLNRADYVIFNGAEYRVNPRTWRRNLRGPWVVDNDPYLVNQLGHPYQGSMYHGFARASGLDFWPSLGYTFMGSAFWEIFGENTPPSKNDQVASGIAGSFLGEALFRISNLLLERQTDWPYRWRELAAAAISPPVGFNRYAFGDRFRDIFPSHDPEYYSRAAIGVSATTQNIQGAASDLKRTEVVADFSMDYGLPGKPGYTYKRPFDYFTIRTTAASGNGFENLLIRGLLLGDDYKFGDRYRGIWGLYGSYDYIAPQIFRISSTALSLGTTGQFWLTNSIALQGTGLVGVGYAAAGTLHGEENPERRDYHYGFAPQALLALRLIYGDKWSLDLTGREYFVSKLGGVSGTGGHDNIARLDAALTWRISGRHAVSLRYLLSRRDATFNGIGDVTQQRGTIGLYYTLLGHQRFGAVNW